MPFLMSVWPMAIHTRAPQRDHRSAFSAAAASAGDAEANILRRPPVGQIKLGRYNGGGCLLGRLVYDHRSCEHRPRLAEHSATPLIDQAAGNVVAPRYIANPRPRLKCLRQDPLALFIAPATPALRPRQYRHSAPWLGTDVLTCGCKDVLYSLSQPPARRHPPDAYRLWDEAAIPDGHCQQQLPLKPAIRAQSYGKRRARRAGREEKKFIW